MESIVTAYQHLCEVRFRHQHLTGSTAALPVPEWLVFYPDEETNVRLHRKHLVIRPSATGFNIAARVKANKEPFAELNGTRLKIGFSLGPAVARHTKLAAHFLLGGKEGRYVFGNSVSRLAGSTFPDISKDDKIPADPTEPVRVFGYIEIDILKSTSPYDLLDATGKIKYAKGAPDSKFQLLFEK